MKKIAIYEIVYSYYNEDDYSERLGPVTDFTEVSDEDYNLIKTAILNQGYVSGTKYVLVEPVLDKNTSIEEFKKIAEKMLVEAKKIIKRNEDYKKKQEAADKARKLKAEKNKEAKEKKKFEELKAKFEGKE